jgi:hypothetical protein
VKPDEGELGNNRKALDRKKDLTLSDYNSYDIATR